MPDSQDQIRNGFDLLLQPQRGWERIDTEQEVFKYIAEQTPIGEVTTLETFTNAMMFFAKKDSDGVTGQNLIVDGGLTFN